MSDALNLALTITATDLAGGVLRRLRDRIVGTGDAARHVRKDFDLMERSIRRGTKSLAIAGYVAAKLRPGVKAASDLQEELLGVRAELMRSGTSAADLAAKIAKVKSTAFSVQKWTPFDESQVVALEKNLVKSGARIQDVIGKQGAAAAAAALGTYSGLDPSTTGNILIGIGTPFKVATSGYMKLADQISRASSASVINASEVAEAASYAAGPLSALKRTPKEMLALIGTLGQAGIRGSMAGTSLANFFQIAARHKVFRNANGDLKSTAEIIDILNKKLGHLGAAERSARLSKIFGQDSVKAAIALMNEGKGGFEDILRQMDRALPLSKKLEIRMRGFNKQLESLKGTSASTIANLFEPALGPLTAIVSKTNDWVAALGKAAEKHEAIGKAVTYGGGALVGAGVVYGAAKIAQGGLAGMRVLRGLKGLGTGVAAGKALQAAAGVTPVYVVNMPAGGLGGTAGAAASIAKRGPGWLKRIGAAAAGLGRTGLSLASRAAPLAARAGVVGGAGGVGYFLGHEIHKHAIAGTRVDDWIGSAAAHVMALLGSKTARESIALTNHQQPINGTIRIEVDAPHARAHVKDAHMDHPGIDLAVERGIRGATGW